MILSGQKVIIIEVLISSYFDNQRHFVGGGGLEKNDIDGTYIPFQWGRPNSPYEEILITLSLLY